MRSWLRVMALVGLLMAAPVTVPDASAAQTTACENVCAGEWFACRFLTFPSPLSQFCDGYLYGCLLGCKANV